MRRPLYGIARPEPERTPTGLGERCVSQNPAVATEMMKENMFGVSTNETELG